MIHVCNIAEYIKDKFPGVWKRAEKELEVPSAERVGYWIEGQTAGQRFFKCSRCGHIEFDGTPNYCEDCGARMVSEDVY